MIPVHACMHPGFGGEGYWVTKSDRWRQDQHLEFGMAFC